MREEFAVHLLNVDGVKKANDLASLFSDFLDGVEALTGADGREIAIVRTKLEEASYYAKRAIAQRPENQGSPQPLKIENAMDAMDREMTYVRTILDAAKFTETEEEKTTARLGDRGWAHFDRATLLDALRAMTAERNQQAKVIADKEAALGLACARLNEVTAERDTEKAYRVCLSAGGQELTQDWNRISVERDQARAERDILRAENERLTAIRDDRVEDLRRADERERVQRLEIERLTRELGDKKAAREVSPATECRESCGRSTSSGKRKPDNERHHNRLRRQ